MGIKFNIKCLLAVLFLFLMTSIKSQSGFLKIIADSSVNNNYGKVAFLAVDSNYVHVVFNSNFKVGGFCNGGNGTIYYTKLNKHTGQIISARKILNGGMVSRAAAGCYYNNCIYLGGETANPFIGRSAFILKFNTQTNSIIWQKNFSANSSFTSLNIESALTDIELSADKNKLAFFGKGLYQPSSSFSWFGIAAFKGLVDTSGNNFNAVPFGFNGSSPSSFKTNPSFTNAGHGKKSYAILNDTATKNINIITLPNNNMVWDFGSGYELNIQTTGHHFVDKSGNKIIYIVDKANGSTGLVTDTLNNIIIAKEFNGLHVRNLTSNNNDCLFTFVNDIGSGKGNEIINITTDTLLNILAGKKMFIDTFQIKEFNFYGARDNNFIYNVFNKKDTSANEIIVRKHSLTSLNCNEQFFNPSLSSSLISTVSCILSPTSSISQTTIVLNSYLKGLVDSSFCYIGNSAVPSAGFSTNIICQNTNYLFTDLSTNNPTSWLWSFQGGSISTSTLQNPVVNYNLPGIYTITLTASNNFGSNSIIQSVTVSICTNNLERLETKINIGLHPNPANDIINLEIQKPELFSKIRIINSLGQVMKEQEVNTVKININDLPNGVYFFNLISDKLGTISKKFIIVH